MFDFVPQVLAHKKMEICTDALGSQSFIFLYKRFKVVRLLPEFTYSALCKVFALCWRVYLPVQRNCKFL